MGDGQIRRQGRIVQTRARSTFVRDRRGQTAEHLRGNVRDRKGRTHRGANYGNRQNQLRLPSRSVGEGPVPARTEVQQNGRVLPFRTGTVRKGRDEILFVGGLRRSVEVRVDVVRRCRQGMRRKEGRNLEEMGRLKIKKMHNADRAQKRRIEERRYDRSIKQAAIKYEEEYFFYCDIIISFRNFYA